MKRKNRWDRQLILIAVLLCVTILALCTTFWALFFREPQRVLMPDYAPVTLEANASPIPGDADAQNRPESGSGSVSLTYSDQVHIDPVGGTAQLLFANPGKSDHDMVLQLIIQDAVIFQSGRLTPGNQIEELKLAEEAVEMLMPGGYEGEFLISFYDPDSGEKAIVNTRIPVSVTVAE